MQQTYKETAEELSKKLTNAFRHGSSAFRYGLMPAGISDHLPIVAKIPFSAGPVKLLSWNLLAEEHLFNNFRNISGIDLIEKALNESLGKSDNIYAGENARYHLMAEIGEYLQGKLTGNSLTIDRELLEGFIPVSAQKSMRARSRNAGVAAQRVAQVEKARRAFVDTLLNEVSPDAHEYRLTLKHCLEMIDHIKSPDGVLRWENRFKKLTENTAAVFELCAQDVLAFQECTKPSDLKKLIKQATGGYKKMRFISHNLSQNRKSTDNVVLAFDKDKFKLVKAVKTSFEGKKPAIYCLLEDIENREQLIVGSIHHPGGDHDLTGEILQQVKALRNGNGAIPYYIAGDYNHTTEVFPIQCPTEKGGSMAGSDYKNTNAYIDGIMSNQDLSGKVKRSACVQLAQPSAKSIDVTFDLAAKKTVVIEPLLKGFLVAQSIFARGEASKVCQAMPLSHDDTNLGERASLSIGLQAVIGLQLSISNRRE